MTNHKKAILYLRFGLAFVFLYVSVSAFLFPNNWIWFIPDWIQKVIPGEPLLLTHSAFELFLGIWFLTGKKAVWVGLVSALDLVVIMLLNIFIFDTVFRDMGLLFAALAYVMLNQRNGIKS